MIELFIYWLSMHTYCNDGNEQRHFQSCLHLNGLLLGMMNESGRVPLSHRSPSRHCVTSLPFSVHGDDRGKRDQAISPQQCISY